MITIGIVTKNRPNGLKIVFESLKKQTYKDFKVIVVDNSDVSYKSLIDKIYDKENLEYIKGDDLKLPTGRNVILNRTKTKEIVFIDDDVYLKPNWLEEIVKTFKKYPKAAGVTGPAINAKIENGKIKITEKILKTDKNQNYILPWGEVRNESRRWIPSKNVICYSMLGANMSFRTELLKEIGGFDEAYEGNFFREESDPQTALVKKGYFFIYNPKVFLYHLRFKQGGAREKEKTYEYFGANHKYYSDKYFNPFLARLSWLFFSRNPPNLWLAFLRTIFEGKDYLSFHKGLWFIDLKNRAQRDLNP